ncbi:hypothetical protein E4J56_23025, partial [Escherichia coli]|nr:hypothetical protein [Escherichia coli]
MAMRRTYSQVKFVNWVVFFLSVVMSVAIVIFTTVIKKMGLFPHLTIAPYLGYYGIIVLVITIIFSTMISSMKKCAATIQEMFDCDVLHIPWSELKVGKPVGRENVFKASRYYKKRNKNDEFINWYLNKDYDANENVLALLCHAKNFG